MSDSPPPLSVEIEHGNFAGQQPFLTVIVIAWNNAEHIGRALQSCIFRTSTPFEIVVVCPPSDDGTEQIVERFAGDHEQLVRLHKLPVNHGPGPARNAGIELAKGVYIAMLDGDDWFDASLPAKLLPILEEQQPDVLVFDHIRMWPDGKCRPNPNRALLKERDCSTRSRRARLIGNLNVAWNKIYKRSFLTKNCLKFSDGLYEDIGWHYDVLCTAESYVAVPDALIHYWQRPGSLLNSRNDTHFDMLAQFETVLIMLCNDATLLAAYGDTSYLHARKLLLNLIINEQRLPVESERDFVAQTSRLLRRWRKSIGRRKVDALVLMCMFRSAWLLRRAHRLGRRTRSKFLRVIKQVTWH